jgi:hypothetical protein
VLPMAKFRLWAFEDAIDGVRRLVIYH